MTKKALSNEVDRLYDTASHFMALGDAGQALPVIDQLLCAFFSLHFHQVLQVENLSVAVISALARKNSARDIRAQFATILQMKAGASGHVGAEKEALEWGAVVCDVSSAWVGEDPLLDFVFAQSCASYTAMLAQHHQFHQAEEILDNAVSLLSAAAPVLRCMLSVRLADIYVETRRLDEAKQLLLSFEGVPLDEELPHVSAEFLQRLAALCYEDQPRKARRILRNCVDLILSKDVNPRLALQHIAKEAWLSIELDEFDTAIDRALFGLCLTEGFQDKDAIWRLTEALGTAYRELGRSHVAAFFLKRAVQSVQELRARRREFDSALPDLDHFATVLPFDRLIEALVSAGRLGEARQAVELKQSDVIGDERFVEAAFLSASENEAAKQLSMIFNSLRGLPDLDEVGFQHALQQCRSTVENRLEVAWSSIVKTSDHRLIPEGLFEETFTPYTATLYIDSSVDGRRPIIVMASLPGERIFVWPTDQERGFPSHLLHRLIQSYLLAIRNGDVQTELAEGSRLARLLFEPWLPEVAENVRRIRIIANGPAREIPFSALPINDVAAISRGLVLARCSRNDAKINDPIPGTPRILAVAAPDGGGKFGPLQYAKEEIDRIRPVSRALIGLSEFTAEKLALELPRHDVLHVASHFNAHPTNIAQSYLVAGDGSEISVRQLSKMPIGHLELVVLSACTSAVSSVEELEGNFAVDQMLLDTGVKSALGMLWPVDDQATALLMGRFHAGLRGGLDKAEALAAAQRSMAAGEDGMVFRDAYYWAGATLFGSWRGWQRTT